MRRLLLAGATLALLTGAASGTPTLRARVSPAPATFAGPAWKPSIAHPAGGRPTSARLRLTIRRGASARTFVPRALRRGRYRVTVAFPSTGRWAWTVTTGRRTLARGAVTVTTLFRFKLPYDLALEPGGTIVFPDRGRILAWSPATQRVTVRATTPSEELVALVRHADGTLYGADFPGNRILRIDPAGRVSTAAQVRTPADLVLDAQGVTLWVGSLDGGERVVDAPRGVDMESGSAVLARLGLDRSRQLRVEGQRPAGEAPRLELRLLKSRRGEEPDCECRVGVSRREHRRRHGRPLRHDERRAR